ncbi:MAG: AraC family transcriptional regulator [Klebsiella oxytoca]|nr:AraC family transcriptional regulator [Klebsiella oxytoca]
MSHQDIIQTLIEWIDEHIDLGYVSQQTFSRVFRREFDRTPTDYRHQISA